MSPIVERRSRDVRAVIEDNGQGFDRAAVSEAPDAARKMGLTGMEERATQARGQLDIETTAGTGKSIYVRIPLPPDANKRDVVDR